MNDLINIGGVVLVLGLCVWFLWYTVQRTRARWRQKAEENNEIDQPASSAYRNSYKPPSAAVANEPQAVTAPVVDVPFKLAYANALGRLCDSEWSAIHTQAPDILDRLKKASRGLELGDHNYTEGLLLATLIAIRGSFGPGKHWLEAVVLSDLAIYCHFAKKSEDAAWRFGQAQQVAAQWLGKYPWLKDLCSAQRLSAVLKQKKRGWF
jgi:hypothetical protein